MTYDELTHLVMFPKNCYPDVAILGECISTVLNMEIVVKSIDDTSFDINTSTTFDASSGYRLFFEPYIITNENVSEHLTMKPQGQFFGFLVHTTNNHFDVFTPNVLVELPHSS